MQWSVGNRCTPNGVINGMVQTGDQYSFIHNAVRDELEVYEQEYRELLEGVGAGGRGVCGSCDGWCCYRVLEAACCRGGAPLELPAAV
jgi:hypothetical protein